MASAQYRQLPSLSTALGRLTGAQEPLFPTSMDPADPLLAVWEQALGAKQVRCVMLPVPRVSMRGAGTPVRSRAGDQATPPAIRQPRHRPERGATRVWAVMPASPPPATGALWPQAFPLQLVPQVPSEFRFSRLQPRLPACTWPRPHGLCPVAAASQPRSAPGPDRASPVRSRQPSSAHSRTPVSQQLTMVSATRPVRPVPALPAADDPTA